MEAKPNLIPELLGTLRRRRVPMALTFVIIAALSFALALFWPPTYQSTGVILIEQQEVPSELVRSTISSYADQRIQVIQKQVMTTENLLRIVLKYDLYARQRKTETRERIIRRISEDVQFRMISADVVDPRSGVPTRATIAFSVGYNSRSPDLAARVANELVSLYLEQNIESRKQRTADAADFLGGEAQRLNARIEELQAQIAAFKEQHPNDLPELSQHNQSLMIRLDEEVRETDMRMRSLDQQITYLDAQLAQISPTSQVYTSTGERVLSPADRLKFVRTEFARLSAIYSPDHPDVVKLKREMEGLEQSVDTTDSSNDLQRQLNDAKTQLASAQQKYAADHPDVVRLQRLVASLGQQLAQAPQGPATAAARQPDNPAYIQVKSQREGSVNERNSLARKTTTLKAQIGELEGYLATAPAVERDYMKMVREVENDQAEYRTVKQRQMEADSSQHLEAERKGERMTLIEPPFTPTEPASPNRTMIVSLGLLFATGAAVGIAALLNLVDTSVRSRHDLTALLSVPPLAVLPWIETKADVERFQRVRRYSVVAIAAFMVLAATFVHLFVKPLDVILQVALRWVTA
jgi:uncharacterized protein involved in exopolysaccharide biosynthesis